MKHQPHPHVLTDNELVGNAVYHAQRRAQWRAQACDPHSPLTRRQCLVRASQHEQRIASLAITAELRCERDAAGAWA